MTQLTLHEVHDPKYDEFWKGDSLGRRSEAGDLIAYIKSLSTRSFRREDKQAYSIAIDARYGEGKTFFLTRLSRHLQTMHPVAYVDAWSDDLQDEPLTALAATLKEALHPFLKDKNVSDKFDEFLDKSGKVAKIVGRGIARRTAAFVIGSSAVAGVEAVFDGASENLADALQEAGEGIADDASEAVKSITAHSLMAKRVADFEEGQAAVNAMKESLSGIIASLGETSHTPPIIIIIDELDRCRPTYAIKLLEEIKHLYDVPGLVFLLGMHGEQLGHSVSGAYGASFDGRAYLRRFVDREFRLKQPDLMPLLAALIEPYDMANAVEWPPITMGNEGSAKLSLADILSKYMHIYGLGARDAYQLIDVLQTSIALAQGQKLNLAYFIPLAISRIVGLPRDVLPTPMGVTKYTYLPNWSRMHSENVETFSFHEIAEEIHREIGKGWQYYHEHAEKMQRSYGLRVASRDCDLNQHGMIIGSPSSYPRLLDSVGQFANPKLTT